jgi:hypothetical protein
VIERSVFIGAWLLSALLPTVLCGAKPGGATKQEPVRLIFDTDMGNDIDDAFFAIVYTPTCTGGDRCRSAPVALHVQGGISCSHTKWRYPARTTDYFRTGLSSIWSKDISPTAPSRPMRMIASRALGGTLMRLLSACQSNEPRQGPRLTSPTPARFSS